MQQTWVVRGGALALMAALSLVPRSVRADDDPDTGKSRLVDGNRFQDGMGIMVGVSLAGGSTELASTNLELAPNAQGIVIRDRNGMTSRMVFGLLVAIGGALAASGPKSISSSTAEYGSYRVTTTTTTYYSEAEKAEMRENTNSAIDGLFSAKISDFELHLWSRDRFGYGDTSGYKLNFFIGGGDQFVGEVGFGFGEAESIVNRAGMPVTVHYKYVGMPLRGSTTIGPLRAAITYEWNWQKYGIEATERQLRTAMDGSLATTTASHPWKLELSTIALKRIALLGGLTWQQIQKPGTLGYVASASIAF